LPNTTLSGPVVTMPTLLELQEAMRAELFALEPIQPSVSIGQYVRADGIAAGARLQIHRNHIRTSLTDALAAIYASVSALVGADFFRAAAAHYIAETQPHEPVLYAYGGGFSAFLAGFSPAAGLPYLPDLARLEWAMHESFHSIDQPTLAHAALAALAAEDLEDAVLTPRADVRLMASDWPVDALWQAAHDPTGAAIATVDLDAGSVTLLLVRLEQDVRLWPIPFGEWHWLTACAAGKPLGLAAAEVIAAAPGFNLTAALTANLQRGTFTSLTPARRQTRDPSHRSTLKTEETQV
jgi:hypothetical protein